jgi:hypothetical protein
MMTAKERRILRLLIDGDFKRYFSMDEANEIAEAQNNLDIGYRTLAGPWILNEMRLRAAMNDTPSLVSLLFKDGYLPDG